MPLAPHSKLDYCCRLRTLQPSRSQFTLKPTQVRDWPNFTREIKDLLDPYCGKYEPFMPVIRREVFGVANELGVQGCFVNNALHPVGEIANLLRLGVCFGDPQYGINRRQDEIKKGKKRKHGAQKTDNVKGKLVPDLTLTSHHGPSAAKLWCEREKITYNPFRPPRKWKGSFVGLFEIAVFDKAYTMRNREAQLPITAKWMLARGFRLVADWPGKWVLPAAKQSHKG
ncbi:hypothetical protein ANOM_005215 [Aspergillus nomiae NRRL 13137]|uniref:Uncharacterized protein n=1 Tax=Aspergillus nomiae NRRL (strain ATCC 15546 / NRRL 13137 / CBS 260.88 / M93) TaxID=1509407 RepID=A0A0L1J3I4_ASPN3|nr:uncharacterized protein ANOM_005215 [Aspergillus nomiae NRRL 13137]KNG86314.1 hypothetical protein ANOM_005215 [Aspergillus nomiae NRRL 13137]